MTKVRLADGRTLIHNEPDAALLTTLEQAGHYAECRSGYCGACRVELKKGQVRYQQTPLALLKRDEILPCCCTPTEDLELA